MSERPLSPSLPYYVSQAKVAFLCAQRSETEPARKVSKTFRLGLKPELERKVEIDSSGQGNAAAPDLDRAILAVAPRLVWPIDPSLMARDWFELDAPCLFGKLRRDSRSDGTTVATWFAEVLSPTLEQGFWFFLTGSPENLIEEWLPEGPRNRSGSQTESAYDLLVAAAREEGDLKDSPDDGLLFRGLSSMRNMLYGSHRLRAIAMVHRVITDQSGRFSSTSWGSLGVPIVRAVIGTPLFVESVSESNPPGSARGRT